MASVTPRGRDQRAQTKGGAEQQDALGSYLSAVIVGLRGYIVVLVAIFLVGLMLAATVERTLKRSVIPGLIHSPAGSALSGAGSRR
jgi:hypothetical protein